MYIYIYILYPIDMTSTDYDHPNSSPSPGLGVGLSPGSWGLLNAQSPRRADGAAGSPWPLAAAVTWPWHTTGLSQVAMEVGISMEYLWNNHRCPKFPLVG